ncbi:MAG: coproporphyrinogen-III oxidase family protein [Syntrophobacteraceae bacterium]
MNNGELPGLYLHIPFCRSKCFYCDFYSVASRSEIPAWLEAVRTEMALYREEFPAFDSLYLGGGTPSVLSEHDLASLFESIFKNFVFAPGSEMTMEANPESLSPSKLKTVKDFGVNRVSLGVQSLDDRDLEYLGRAHRAARAFEAVEMCRAAGFSNLSVDLIYGLETQTFASWKKTLDRVLELRPEHISCYQLTFEKGAALWKMRESGRVHSIGEKFEAAFFVWTSRYLERHGYFHYEVSNFSADRQLPNLPKSPFGKGGLGVEPAGGFPGPNPLMCRHNRKYWRHVPYLGLGPSAHSFDSGQPIPGYIAAAYDGHDPAAAKGSGASRPGDLAAVAHRRRWNVRSVREYCRLLKEGKAPVEGMEILSREQFDLETVDLALRTREGLELNVLKGFSQRERVLAQWQKSGLVKVIDGRVQPTRKGFLVADSMALQLCDP